MQAHQDPSPLAACHSTLLQVTNRILCDVNSHSIHQNPAQNGKVEQTTVKMKSNPSANWQKYMAYPNRLLPQILHLQACGGVQLFWLTENFKIYPNTYSEKQKHRYCSACPGWSRKAKQSVPPASGPHEMAPAGRSNVLLFPQWQPESHCEPGSIILSESRLKKLNFPL